MKPTGWFQVAWSAEIGKGDVTRMTYFGHLGAHLGYGGTVVGDRLQCPFHGWEWTAEGRNACIPYETRPNLGARIQTLPTVERNEAVYVWHDVHGRPPHFDVPDVFTA